MYPTPNVLHANLFTSLPVDLRRDREPNAWEQAARPGRRLHSFLEGPSFDRKGNLYCVDVAHGRIFQISPDGRWRVVADYDGHPNGLKIHRDGRIFVADAAKGIVTLDPASGEVRTFLEGYGDEPFQGCNDLMFASNGDLYFTDPGDSSLTHPTGRVFCARADGELELLLDKVPYPNGLTLDLTENDLLVAVTDANAIWRTPARRGVVRRNASLFIQMSGGPAGPDGMAIDADGNIFVAHARHGTVWKFSPRGEPVARIRTSGGDWTTNVAFGGETNRWLYITEAESGSILKVELDVPGHPMFAHHPF